MSNRFREILELSIAEPSECDITLQKAATYYAEPLTRLKLKAPLPELYAAADTDEPIGHWVSNIPRPGDVAGCLNKKKPRRGNGIF